MLLILGTKSYNLENGKIDDFVCPKCSTKTFLNFSFYKQYTYLTFIPLFPVNKKILTSCDNCNKIISYDELDNNSKISVSKIKSRNNFLVPVWMYIGTIILILVSVYGVNTYISDNDKSKLYLKTPIVGDVYKIKLSNGYYTTERIDKITNDSIFVTQNNYNAYLPYETDDIDKSENYSNSKAKYSKKEVVSLFNKKVIYSITRN